MIQEEGVLKSQELENAVRDADYTKVIQIAFKLRRPHKLYESFHELFRLASVSISLLLASFWLSLELLSCILPEFPAGRERVKSKWRKPFMTLATKSWQYFLTMLGNGTQSQSSAMSHSLFSLKFSTFLIQKRLLR